MSDPHEEGRIAYIQNKPLTANPYGPRSERFDMWSAGWRMDLDNDLDAQPLEMDS